MAVNYANTIKYSGKGYLDEKMNPVANLAALEDKFDAIKELKAGMTVTVLDDGSGVPTDYVYDGSQWIKKVDLSDYAKLEDIPSVPSKTSQLANDSGFVTSAQTQAAINDAVNGIEIPDPADLTNYYTKGEVDSAITEAVESITVPDVSGKADTTAVTQDIETAIAAETARTESTYLKSTDLNGYATEEWVGEQGYLKTSNQAFPSNWHTTGTMSQLIEDINADSTAVVGKTYISTVRFSDLPISEDEEWFNKRLNQGELKAEIMSSIDGENGKVILFTLTSTLKPYHWEYSSLYGATDEWKSFLSEHQDISTKQDVINFEGDDVEL